MASAPKRFRRIGLFGQFGRGNSGNDGSMEAMLLFLRQQQPNAFVASICPTPQRMQADYGIPGISIAQPPLRRAVLQRLDRLLLHVPRLATGWFYAIQKMRHFDLLIVPGTGILDDFNTGPAGMPYALFRWCLAAWLSGTEIWFVSVGAGPISHPLSQWLMKSAARVASYRSYRDIVSKRFMAGIGLDTRSDPVCPDIAFKLPAPKDAGAPRPDGGPLTVALGIMSYGGWRGGPDQGAEIFRAYIAKMVRFLTWLLDQGYNVRILTGDVTDREAVATFRRAAADALPDLPAGRLVVEETSNLHELMRQIVQTDLVVATRYHNVVCALKLCRPTISIGYADKNDALLADMGLGEFCQHVEKLDVDLLMRQFTQIADRRDAYRQHLVEANQALQERLARQDAVLAAKR
jgi:polysaccharide pyruvyl transferase WcaK-like protein